MLLAKLLGAPWLGHGRLMEAMLAFVCGLYGALLLMPHTAWESQATYDLAWTGYGQLVALPFLLKSVLTSYGLLANIRGWHGSRVPRLCGAFVGSFLWAWLIWKYGMSGALLSFGSVCAMVFLLASIRIMGMALADLPCPGEPETP